MSSFASNTTSSSGDNVVYHCHYTFPNPGNNLYEEYDMGGGWRKIVCLDAPYTSKNPSTEWKFSDYDYHEDWLKDDKEEEEVKTQEDDPIEIKIEKPEPEPMDLVSSDSSADTPRILEKIYYDEEEKVDDDDEVPPLEEDSRGWGDEDGVSVQVSKKVDPYWTLGDKVEYCDNGFWYNGTISEYDSLSNTYVAKGTTHFGNDKWCHGLHDHDIRSLSYFYKDLLVEVLWQDKWYKATINDCISGECPSVMYEDIDYYGEVEYEVEPKRIRFYEMY